jgi:hypothetical protein
MITRLFTITAVVLVAALSACAVSAPSPRVATAQAPSSRLHVGTVRPALDCAYYDSSFNTPDAMKLPKDALGCAPQ